MARRVRMKLEVYCWFRMAGELGRGKYAVRVPWKSAEMEMRLLASLRVLGQYLSAHWHAKLPCDQAINVTGFPVPAPI